MFCIWTAWKAQGGTFNDNHWINLGTSEIEHRLTCVTLTKAKNLIQISLLLAITGPMIDNLNNNSKTVLCVQHEME